MLETLRYQVRYAAWANARIIEAVSELSGDELVRDFGTADQSVCGTLAHIYRAERIWLGRIEGQALEFRVAGDDALASLHENWPGMSERWIARCDGLTAQDAAGDLLYSDLKGNPWRQPLWKIILHVVNHSTHHRGQVVGFLRALGRTPPNVDSINFARSGG